MIIDVGDVCLLDSGPCWHCRVAIQKNMACPNEKIFFLFFLNEKKKNVFHYLGFFSLLGKHVVDSRYYASISRTTKSLYLLFEGRCWLLVIVFSIAKNCLYNLFILFVISSSYLLFLHSISLLSLAFFIVLFHFL